MFQYHAKLDPLLQPADYASESFFALEQARIFPHAWCFAGLDHDVARPGDYYATEIRGVPVVIKNTGGELRAFRNVCLHRQSRIVPLGCGHADTLRCGYHGWEYGEEGQLAKIPDGASFKGLHARDWKLDRFRVERLGSLMFVNLNADAPSLRGTIGDLADEIDYFFGDHKAIWRWTTEYPVNWKIIVENAVESYHVPVMHPSTFMDYKKEEYHDHQLHPAYTSYLDVAPMGSSLVERALRAMTSLTAKNIHFERAKHTHIFPNHLFDYREICSLYSSVEPLGPQRTRLVSIGLLPRRVKNPVLVRPIQSLFRVALTRMARKIMGEDVGIWNEVQRGVEQSAGPGVLSCREERVFAFQRYLADCVGAAEP
jgi:phenylpropionate dioxygenase-like ring-hydroxylating dioxygenase large terminal subunit